MTSVREAPSAKVSVLTLSAFVVGSMVGAGVFSLPSSFAASTGVALSADELHDLDTLAQRVGVSGDRYNEQQFSFVER